MNKFKDIFIILTLSCIFTSQTASYGSSKLVTYVSKSNFMAVGAQTLAKTFNITSPGIYVLTEDITSVSTTRTILINSNNVTVDLNGYTITGKTDSSMNGIEVAQDMNNIEIKNGTIYSVGKSGILVNQNVHNIKISNVECNSCNINNVATTGGITLAGAVDPNEIAHCVIDNCLTFSTVPQTQNAYGIYANYTNHLTISHCHTDSVRNIGKTFQGVGYYIDNCKYPIIQNSSASLCEGDLIGAGFYLITCTTTQIQNCISNGNASSPTYAASSVTTGTGAGFYFNDTNNSIVENCKASNNSSGVTAAGFLQESCFNNQFIACTASGQSVSNATLGMEAAGFRTVRDTSTPKGATKGCIFKNCNTFGQLASTNPSSIAAGFILGNDTRTSTITNCSSFSNDGNTNGFGIGIELVSTTTNIYIEHSNVSNNISNAKNKGIGIRDSTASAINLLAYNFAFNNRDTIGTQPQNNYSLSYSTANVIADTDIVDLASITLPTIKNISITPY